MRHQLRKNVYIEPKRITFERFAETYLGQRTSIRPSTLSGYKSINQQHLLPFFGKMPLNHIRFEVIQDFVLSLQEDFSPKTIRNCYGLLRTMLSGKKGKTAIRLGFIQSDPTQGVELPPRQQCVITPIDVRDVWRLIEAGSEFGFLEQSLVYLGASTGARRGELLALRFPNIDWDSKEILINRAITRAKATDGIHTWQWVLGPPKTRKSVRRVIVSPDVLDYLKRMKATAKDSEGFLFASSEGDFISPDFLDVLFNRIRTRAHLPKVRFHDLRHFFCSSLINRGFNAEFVRDQLGHSSIAVTFDVYGHLFQKTRREAPDKLQAGMKQLPNLNSASDCVSETGDFDRKGGSDKLLN